MSPCAGKRGQPGGGPAALHVDEDARRLRHRRVADVLHHQGEARSGGDRERLGAGPYRALDGDGSRQFVLHLDEDAADGGDARGEPLHDLGGGCNGVPCGKSRTRCQCALAAGVVAVHENGSALIVM
jgi:hypothetical protein